MKRPVIGITCNYLKDIPDAVQAGIAAPGQSWELIAEDYIQAIENAGGISVILPVHAHFEKCSDVLERLNGVLISGGNDVSPSLYGDRFDPKCGLLDAERDDFEIELTRRAINLGIPLLGICRGVQLMNIVHGGTLYQDLPSSGYPSHSIWSGDRNNPTHRTVFPEGSPLRGILGCNETWVNSFHHQAIKELGEGLAVAAISEGDGVIEGVYRPDSDFAVAVQWHPEMMPGHDVQKKIFTAFIAASGKKGE